MEINFFFPLRKTNRIRLLDGYARLNNQSFARFSRNEIQLNEAIEFRVKKITMIFVVNVWNRRVLLIS